MRSKIYRLSHHPTGLEYYFHRTPRVSDMVNILRRLGYEMKGNKIIADNNGIPSEWTTREEFGYKRVKFED